MAVCCVTVRAMARRGADGQAVGLLLLQVTTCTYTCVVSVVGVGTVTVVRVRWWVCCCCSTSPLL